MSPKATRLHFYEKPIHLDVTSCRDASDLSIVMRCWIVTWTSWWPCALCPGSTYWEDDNPPVRHEGVELLHPRCQWSTQISPPVNTVGCGTKHWRNTASCLFSSWSADHWAPRLSPLHRQVFFLLCVQIDDTCYVCRLMTCVYPCPRFTSHNPGFTYILRTTLGSLHLITTYNETLNRQIVLWIHYALDWAFHPCRQGDTNGNRGVEVGLISSLFVATIEVNLWRGVKTGRYLWELLEKSFFI
jgi:hypothetical protein